MAHPKEYTIVVNGTEHKISGDSITYEQLVDLAFPGHPNDPNIIFKVTFTKADGKPHQGTLAPGGAVQIKHNGTTFDVSQTNRS
jgi:hypothetical protein